MPSGVNRDRESQGRDSRRASRELLAETIRFLLTGGINTAFSYAIYAAAIFVGAGYALAAAVSLGAGILFSYQTVRRLVFKRAGDGSLIRYAGCYAIVYGFNVMLLKLIDAFGVNPYVCGLLAAVPTALFSFALLKMLVFRSARPD